MSDTWIVGTVTSCDAGFGFLDDAVFFTAAVCPGGTLPALGTKMKYCCQPRLDLPMKKIATKMDFYVKEKGFITFPRVACCSIPKILVYFLS